MSDTTVPMDRTMDALPALFARMNLEQLRSVNRQLVGEINHRHAQASAKAAARFKIGDLIEFTDDRRGRKVRATVERINAKSLSVREFHPPNMPWRVSPNLCRLVGA